MCISTETHNLQQSLTPCQPTSLPLLVAEKEGVQWHPSVMSLATLASMTYIGFGSHKSLVNKLTRYRMDGWAVRTSVSVTPSTAAKQNI
jgi:hypothetical protein